jgi:hypothetical protein
LDCTTIDEEETEEDEGYEMEADTEKYSDFVSQSAKSLVGHGLETCVIRNLD